MKKLIALLMAAVLGLSLMAGCSKKEEKETTPNGDPTTTADVQPSGSSDSSTPGTTPDGNTASSGDLDPDLPATNSDLETDPSLPASNGDLNPDSDTDSTEEP